MIHLTQKQYDDLLDDRARIDWLASTDQSLGIVSLSADCVIQNIGSLRDAIDAAMDLDKLEKLGTL